MNFTRNIDIHMRQFGSYAVVLNFSFFIFKQNTVV